MSNPKSDLRIQINRIKEDLNQIAKFSTNTEGKGISRPGFSGADWKAREWLCEYFRSLGLSARIDGAGNVCGRLGPENTSTILLGSHLDSVPEGGLFDGTLGVVAAMECVRVIQKNSIPLQYAIEIIATSEEEGRFGGMLGSQAITGHLDMEWMESAKDLLGYSLKDAMTECGLSFQSAISAKREPDTIKAFLELHIEQGTILENSGNSIGIVDGISGIFKWDIILKGRADHSGTTPMGMRRDAFLGLAQFGSQIHDIVVSNGTPDTRLTIGEVDVRPGYAHTIPGEVRFTLVGRDLSEEVMQVVAENCQLRLETIAKTQSLEFSYQEASWLSPQKLNPEIRDLIISKARELEYSYQLLPSGAGHDAQFFNTITPTGLIFIPSVGGLSHSPHEFSHWIDVERGSNLLLETCLELAGSKKD